MLTNPCSTTMWVGFALMVLASMGWGPRSGGVSCRHALHIESKGLQVQAPRIQPLQLRKEALDDWMQFDLKVPRLFH